MNVLVINCGSSSVKFKLIDVASQQVDIGGTLERVTSHETALTEVLAAIGERPVDAVGHRVVHGAAAFRDSAEINSEVEAAIEGCIPLAPLHNPANLAGIRAARSALPDVPHVAVFDTAFHQTLPRRAYTYAIDTEFAQAHQIRRYGFHGTSHAFVAREAARYLDTPVDRLRLVTCHLGNGASVCAIENGRSVETSMGMTPLEGLVMGTRCGDIDPGALMAVLSSEAIDVHGLNVLLNKKSGLAGLSGLSNDLRDLEDQAAEGHDGARLAIAVFAHRVRKYIGAYIATMGGADAVILTAGVGENSVLMRRRILQRFDYAGLVFDDDRNQSARVDDTSRVADISTESSRIKALVIATDEELMIAEETVKIALGGARLPAAPPIPVAISGRHVHLTKETFHTLFGPDAELTVRRPLSQLGQFAANECVTLVGPRRRLEHVRILGPFRQSNQVEVSRTDEFFLGVDAPVRASGRTAGSAPITLEGPAGTVHLKEGLICAWRHIHMTPADAEAYGVEDGDEVEVDMGGGPRDLVFRDVLVRVKDSYKLEMHIDTDEGNAAELSQNAEGTLFSTNARAELKRRVITDRRAG